MDAKLIALVEALKGAGCTDADQLADELAVSRRTLRSYVSRANAELDGCAEIIMRRGCGYIIEMRDADRFNAMLLASHGRSAGVPATPEERVEYLVADLLNRADWVTIESLSGALCVSRFTVSDDLKAVEGIFADYGLVLERRSHKGMRVQGSEFARRICLANLALEKLSAGAADAWGVAPDTVARIAHCVDAAVAHRNAHINPAAYQNLLVHIAVALTRLDSSRSTLLTREQLAAAQQGASWQVAQDIADGVAREFETSFPLEEVAYIAIHLAGKQTLADAEPLETNGTAPIPDDAWRMAGRMADRVWESLRFDFREDFELRINLARHLAPLAVRVKYRMQLKNPLLEDIKTRFSLAYSMAVEASTVLSEAYGKALPEDEIGYIALSFALALDRQRANAPVSKNVLVVCASGAGSARLLEYRFREMFGSHIGCIRTCDAHSVATVDFSDIDCVFATVPLAAELPVPVLEVGAFLDDADIPAVRRALRADGAGALARFFDEALFFPHVRAATKDEAIAFMCRKLRELRHADADIEELVLKREAAGYTSFGNNVAMPHPVTPVVDDSVVSVACLEDPVDWDGKPVSVLFLVCISRHKDKTLQPLYRALSRLMGSASDINTLISQQRFATLLELVAANAN